MQATPARHLAVCLWQAGRRDRDRRCRLRAPRADARRGPTRARDPGQSDSSPATAANIAAVDVPEASRMTAVTPSTANSSTATRDRSSQSRNRWGFAGGTVLAACVWSRADRAPLRGLTLWRPTRRRPRGRCGHLRVPRKQENGHRPGWPSHTPVHPPRGHRASASPGERSSPLTWVKHLPGKPRVCCLWPAAPRAGFRPMGTTPGRRRSRRRRPRFCVAVLPTSGSRRAARSRARPRRGGPSGTRWAGARRGRGWARPRGAARRASGRGSGRPAPRSPGWAP